jgi:RimJ/RimL family protein N-acetyltransferase
LTTEVWSRGFATEASRACLRYAFEDAGLGRVIVGADAPNGVSLRVIEKLGMRPVGNLNPGVPEEPYYALGKADFFT